jgi:hypothetical protein
MSAETDREDERRLQQLADQLNADAEPPLSPLQFLQDIWMMPIRRQAEIADASADKPLGEMTMPEMLSWGVVLAYGGATGYVIGTMAANLLAAALGGRRR